MSAIEAASVNVKTLADGTLRLTVDIEPRFALDACRLFMAPGTPMALAALVVGQTTPEKAPEQPEKPKGGALAKLAGILCGDAEFREWLRKYCDFVEPIDESKAAEVVREICLVHSRAELDSDPLAAGLFEKKIRHPYVHRNRT